MTRTPDHKKGLRAGHPGNGRRHLAKQFKKCKLHLMSNSSCSMCGFKCLSVFKLTVRNENGTNVIERLFKNNPVKEFAKFQGSKIGKL